MAMIRTTVQACPHVHDEDRDHPPHMCPSPVSHPRLTDPEWRPPMRVAKREERPVSSIPPEVSARPAGVEEVPTSARDIALLATQVYYARGFPDGDAHLAGTCLTCGQRKTLKLDGTLRKHSIPGAVCAGTGLTTHMSGECAVCHAIIPLTKNGSCRSHRYPTITCDEVRVVPGSQRPDPVVSIMMHGVDWIATWENGKFHVAYVADPRRRRITKITELREWLKDHG